MNAVGCVLDEAIQRGRSLFLFGDNRVVIASLL